ncbi:hypothetical protein D3C80_1982030 [compost metagenome]
MLDAAIGEDELAAWQRLDCLAELRMRAQRGIVDGMRALQKLVRADAVVDHQALKRGAMFVVIALLKRASLVGLEL